MSHSSFVKKCISLSVVLVLIPFMSSQTYAVTTQYDKKSDQIHITLRSSEARKIGGVVCTLLGAYLIIKHNIALTFFPGLPLVIGGTVLFLGKEKSINACQKLCIMIKAALQKSWELIAPKNSTAVEDYDDEDYDDMDDN